MPKLQTESDIRLIVGLGNPGDEYQNTFHNAGFELIDFLAGDEAKWKSTDFFVYCKYGKIILAKTKSFMNDSGRSVGKAVSYFNLTPEETAVAHDDSDLRVGEYKIQFNRGAAGHKGVSSVIQSLKTKEFWRIRMGVRSENPRDKMKKAGEFVLKKISSSDDEKLKNCFKAVGDRLNI